MSVVRYADQLTMASVAKHSPGLVDARDAVVANSIARRDVADG